MGDGANGIVSTTFDDCPSYKHPFSARISQPRLTMKAIGTIILPKSAAVHCVAVASSLFSDLSELQ